MMALVYLSFYHFNYVVYDYHTVMFYMVNRQVNCSNYSKKRIHPTNLPTNELDNQVI